MHKGKVERNKEKLSPLQTQKKNINIIASAALTIINQCRLILFVKIAKNQQNQKKSKHANLLEKSKHA